ncbi:MAG: hypothetical protein NTX15_10655 [Candidatus Kapabacteria bacterium]|nr:hypothetical protein [Candidatus Kapabacteria bacterium]
MVRFMVAWAFWIAPCLTLAQLDDLLDGPWAAPALDILERRRENPMCLRCCTAQDLTEIPGISERTAHAIIRTVNAGNVRSIEQLADTLCLTSDQFVLLTSCTTLDGSCAGIIRAVDSRMRAPTSSTGTTMARVDVDYALGRAGAIYAARSADDTQISGAWATARVSEVDIVIGDYALRLNTGLIMGTARGLSRNASDVLTSRSTQWQMRPWTSSTTDGALRGISVHASIPSSPIDVIGAVSTMVVENKRETLIAFSSSLRTGASSLTTSVVTGMQETSASIGTSHEFEGGSIVAEAALDGAQQLALQANAHYATRTVDLGAALWWYSPNFHAPYGSTSNTVSSPVNHTGILVATRFHPSPMFTGAVSLLYGGRISRSFLVPLPTTAVNITTDISCRPMKGVVISTRLRYERNTDAHAENDLRRMDISTAFTFRTDIDFPIVPSLKGRLRVDLRSLHWWRSALSDRGALMFIDLRWQIFTALSLRARWAQFSSTSGDIAPRMLDATVAGALQTVTGNGIGTRRTITARLQATSWLALSCAIHHDSRVVDGQSRSEMSATLQVDITFLPSKRAGFLF